MLFLRQQRYIVQLLMQRKCNTFIVKWFLPVCAISFVVLVNCRLVISNCSVKNCPYFQTPLFIHQNRHVFEVQPTVIYLKTQINTAGMLSPPHTDLILVLD